MRSVRLSVLAVALAALAGACASPLDEPLGSEEASLRIVGDSELADLPSCDSFRAGDVRGGEVLGTNHDDLYAVSVKGHLVCADDATGVHALERRGLTTEEADDFGPLEGTPLPARQTTSPPVTPPGSDSSSDPAGTPLPANH